ncbi:MAG TPA: glycine cleavage system protein GcvH, partial [Nannocystis exedens]|nr:glycine cleavage system protein GcvH [Nannocystis exedens]
EWIRRDGETLIVGITSHAIEQLGDITMLTLPEVGESVIAGEPAGDIDSVKAVSELFSPVDGEICEVNEALLDAPEQVNQDPYGEGWLLKLKASDGSQLDALMNAEAYRAYVADAD